MRDSKTITRRLAVPVAAALAVSALGAGTAMAQDEPAYAGLDQDLSGTTIKMAAIGGGPYEAMYDSISMFEEETGANVEIVFLGDGFEIDRYLKTNYAAGTVDFDVAWNHTSFMSQYTNFVEPLQDYFTAEELAAFSPSIIEAATIDGNLQLIPRHADISALFYRKDLFEDPDLQAAFEEAVRLSAGGADHARRAVRHVRVLRRRRALSSTGPSSRARKRPSPVASTNCSSPTAATTSTPTSTPSSTPKPVWRRRSGCRTSTPTAWCRPTPPTCCGTAWPPDFCNGDVAVYLEWYGWYSYFQDPEIVS